MIVLSFSNDQREQCISYVDNFPLDASNANLFYYCYNIGTERVEFYGKEVRAYFCIESKSWILFESDTYGNERFMALKSIVVK